VFNVSDSAKSNVFSIYGIDYADYYTAGQMVISGDISNIYNEPIHHKNLESTLGRTIPFDLAWVYPPTFLLAIAPLAYLPYHASLALWLTLTFGLAFFAIYKLLPKFKYLAFLVLGFPGVFMNLKWGQNGFLNTALIGFGIYFVEANPVLAGLMFGLLTYKPQIAFFPLLLLLFSKKWRVLLWSGIFAAISAVLSGLVFGFGSWLNFLNSLTNSSNRFLTWETYSNINTSLYSFLRYLGNDKTAAYIILAIINVAVLFLSCWVWRKSKNFALKGSVMVLGIPLLMPYFLQYDLSLLSIPLVLLAYDSIVNEHATFEMILLEILFFMPMVNHTIAETLNFQLSPVVLLSILGLVVYRVWKEVKKDGRALSAQASALQIRLE
ncbi:MAG: DUF2029 domain-containing protein, partial [Clostridiales bacterium]|nr:DUF2029 domain-containing protein [Clostridiales bacterium]